MYWGTNTSSTSFQVLDVGLNNLLNVDGSGLTTVNNRITGVSTPTGNSDAATKLYVDNTQPLGTIISSALTESQMNTINSKFYLCNGQSCVGTNYASLTSNSVVPDLRGQFLRGLDGSGIVDPGRTLLGSQQDELKSHRHTVTLGSIEEEGGSRDPGGYPQIDLSDLTSNTAADTISFSGGAETRPKNIAINYFIKVN